MIADNAALPAQDGAAPAANAALSAEIPMCLRVPIGCVPGAEPLIVQGNRHGVLLLHGFTGSPWEIKPLASWCVDQGYTVAMPVLAGHSTTVADLVGTSWHDWLDSARAALDWLERRCDVVDICGFSMGGLLAMLLAAQGPPPRILLGDAVAPPKGKLLLLAPALCFDRVQRAAVLFAAKLGRPRTVSKAAPQLPHDLRPPCYNALPIVATTSLFELTEIVRSSLKPLSQSVLVLHGDADPTIPVRRNQRRIREILGPQAEFRVIEGSGHLLLRDARAGDCVKMAAAFLA